MNSAIELHDSECLAIESGSAGKGFVLLDAYVHRSKGRPGREEGEGGIQRVCVAFENMTIDGMVGSLPADIYEGSLETDDAAFDNLIELPASYTGAACLKLMLSEDARILVVSGIGVTIVSENEFCYVEPFSPATTLPSEGQEPSRD